MKEMFRADARRAVSSSPASARQRPVVGWKRCPSSRTIPPQIRRWQVTLLVLKV